MDNKVLQLNNYRPLDPNNLSKSPQNDDNDGDGGEPPMAKYVTHEELKQEMDLSTEKILHHIDNLHAQTDLKINDVKNLSKSANSKANWILGILASVIAGIIVAAIAKLLIK